MDDEVEKRTRPEKGDRHLVQPNPLEQSLRDVLALFVRLPQSE